MVEICLLLGGLGEDSENEISWETWYSDSQNEDVCQNVQGQAYGTPGDSQ